MHHFYDRSSVLKHYPITDSDDKNNSYFDTYDRFMHPIYIVVILSVSISAFEYPTFNSAFTVFKKS